MEFCASKSENSCRICLSSTEWDLVELFSKEKGRFHANKLSFCAGIEVHENDKLPQKICSECLQSVEAACEIKEKCIATDQLLRRHLKPEIVPEQDGNSEKAVDVGFNDVSIKIEPNLDWPEHLDPDFSSYAPAKAEPLQSEDDCDWLEPPAELDDEIPEPDEAPEPAETGRTRQSQPTTEEPKPKPPKPQSRPEDFKCLFCNKVFPKMVDKKKHLLANHKKDLNCRMCKKKRGSPVAAENCMRDHLFGHKFLCQICAQPFRKKGHMEDHIRGVHDVKTDAQMPTCDLCGTKCKYKANIQRHMRTVHMNHKIPCPHKETCPNVFYTTVISLNNHLYRAHNKTAPINCEKCELGFTTASELKGHLKRGCTGGPNKTKRKPKLKLNQFFKEINGQFHCNLCPKVLPTKKYFCDHFQNYHRDNKTCAICVRTFASFVSYRRHKKSVHDKIRDFFCDFPGCGKAFSMKSGQLAHKKTHLKK